MLELPYAEDVNYWKSGQSSPETVMGRAKSEIEKAGGMSVGEGYGSTEGHAAYMLLFDLDGDRFKVVWPVLPTRSGKDDLAARRQAVTMLYHDVKAKCVAAKVKGGRAAFFEYLLLPDGRTAAQATNPELMQQIPAWFNQAGQPQLAAGTTPESDFIEGEEV